MKYYTTTEEGLSTIANFVRTCRPPDGMTDEQKMTAIRDILCAVQNNSYGYQSGIADIVLSKIQEKYDITPKSEKKKWFW